MVLSAIVLGFFFNWFILDLGLAQGLALGAIISPTDATASAIVKRRGVSPRVVAILEGESPLNDATALVLLRAAIAAPTAAIAFRGVAGGFVVAVVVTVAIGVAIEWLNLRIRTRVRDAAVNTARSFTVPFIAYVPAEHRGAAGLVAAIAAGPSTGQGAAQERRRALSLALLGAQREAVLRACDEGSYSAATLTAALEALDADSDQHRTQRPRDR